MRIIVVGIIRRACLQADRSVYIQLGGRYLEVCEVFIPYLLRPYKHEYNHLKCWATTIVKREMIVFPVRRLPSCISYYYQRCSHLKDINKTLRLVVHQLMEYLTSANLLPTLQSGCWSGHSTETAVLALSRMGALGSRRSGET